MAKRTKKNRAESPLRVLVGQTVSALRDRKYKRFDNVTDRNKALCKAADTSFSTIQRIAAGKVDVQLDTLYRIAIALDAKPHELLTPFHAVRPIAELLPATPEARTLQRR